MLLRTTLLLLLCLTSCDRSPAVPTTAPVRQIAVFASTYPLADLARQVGGEHVRVDWLIDLGDPLTAFTPTTAERERMMSHEVIVLDGSRRMEGWAMLELSRMQATGRMVAVADLPIVRTMPPAGLLQLDPMAVRELVPVLVARFGELLPKQRAYFEERGQAFTNEIDSILRAHPNSAFGRGKVLVLDDTLAPLLDRFAIGYARVDADALRLTDREVNLIRDKARATGAQTLLVPFDTPPGTQADIQSRTQLKVVTIDPLGMPNYPGHATYLEVVAYNLAQLKIATKE